MKTFICQVCNHIAFDEAPVDCPVCESAIEHFEKDEEAIKVPADLENLTNTDKEHVPVVHISRECDIHHNNECSVVSLKVGALEHKMDSEHLIEFIDLYINKKYFSRLMFTSKTIFPAALVHLSADTGTLSVISHCNVHGSWRTNFKLDKK
ncbi:MAG: hypothetical protein JSW20_11985 [Nitrospiraceae bacterium]|nr:MAG: hypothetical protein JSW20_11985 [Nitrospiraceae bacterium]